MLSPRVTWLLLFQAIIWNGTKAISAETLFSTKHLVTLRSVVSAKITHDGKRVAYVLSVPRHPLRDEDGPAWSELHVVDEAGQSRPFITGKVDIGEVQWTPDGRSIAFVSKRPGDQNASLYVIPVDGGEARRIVVHNSDMRGVAFSEDGKQVVFLASEPLSKDQQDFRDKGFKQEIYEEDVRPAKVWISPADGSKPPRSLPLTGSAHAAHWRPDGRQLAAVLAPTPLVDDSLMGKRVYIIDVDTGEVLKPVQNPGKLGQVGWSPDGQFLAVVSGAHINDPQEGRLLVVPAVGEDPLRDLMPDYQAHVTSFGWLDSDTLVWAADEGTDSVVGEVDLNGSQRIWSKAGGPIISSLSLAKDGKIAAAVGHTPQHPGEVFLFSPGAESARRLTESNPPLKDVRFAFQEVVKWKARDGLELEGVLVRPINCQAGQRYPLILAVHGGPESHVSNGWVTSYSNPGQLAAARGFAVFYPNYRGSTGRGVAFSMSGQADAAGKEFDDLVDAVDHLVEIGLVEKSKVGITGGSYGGYASAWGATYYSDRFAASVMFVGISSNVSKVGTTDIPEEMYLVHHRKRLWEDWSYFLDRSPIRYVQRNRTPTLILHGKSDPRVHPSQSLELYRHLKTLGQAPVRLVLYPGEGHGNRHAASRLDYSLRLLQWMDHYLRGPGGAPPAYGLDYDKELGE